MSGPLKIDAHIHLYPSAEEGRWFKAGYEIWEYGEREGVDFSGDTGTLAETVAVAADSFPGGEERHPG